jgi:hypothetical protein
MAKKTSTCLLLQYWTTIAAASAYISILCFMFYLCLTQNIFQCSLSFISIFNAASLHPKKSDATYLITNAASLVENVSYHTLYRVRILTASTHKLNTWNNALIKNSKPNLSN